MKSGITSRKSSGFWILLVLSVILAGALSLLAGPMEHPPEWVIMKLRLPRLILALLTGSALSISGCVLQSILRNDLATPYTLGISAGAGLVAGSVIVFGLIMPVMGLVVAGTAGALLAVILVYALAYRSRRADYGSTLLLAGITMNLVGASILLLFEYFSDASRIMEIVRWMMGDMAVIGWSKPLFLLLPVILGIGVVITRTGVLNQISQGDDIAHTRGVSVNSERNLLLAIAALLAGSTVGAVGPVGFVGLMVPHMMRRFVGADYRYLVPASALGGMLLVILADSLSRVVISPAELPIGIVMSLIG
ncbi:MAG: iron chelate uptake ABC transporter family permease subunit, partial [Candidatus Aegiribacteria sp.]|nr:iron chelate uptake ABC transporter family permease subunit [Candidatus Aegiribacteria sp.]